MNVLSLFSGIGGLELGLERAGMTVIGQVEKDAYCRRVLAKHWPEVPRHDDVTTCIEWWRGAVRPSVDVVCGGFPCQPVSLAGKGLAQADERWLWPAMWAVIRDLRPRFAIMENVPGLLGRGIGDVLGDLAAGGYDAEWDCVSAAAVGAPHRRDRIFIVAYPRSHGRERRSEPDGRPAAGIETSLGHAIGLRPAMADAESERRRARRSRRSVGDGPNGPGVTPAGLADADDGGCKGRLVGAGPGAPTGRGQAMAYADRIPTFRSPITRPQRDHWTTEPDVGRVAHGIPARVDRLRALGNAVVPQVAEHVGRLVMAALELRSAA